MMNLWMIGNSNYQGGHTQKALNLEDLLHTVA